MTLQWFLIFNDCTFVYLLEIYECFSDTGQFSIRLIYEYMKR